MIAIIDYGVGNLFSLKSSLVSLGFDACITSDKSVLAAADKLILPGVGAFRDARQKLANGGMDKAVTELARQGKPLLGICLGMQMLFEESLEYGRNQGLGLLKGRVVPMEPELRAQGQSLKVPHIGWNALQLHKDVPLLKNTKQGDYVYFVHSYYAAQCDDSVVAVTEYGIKLTAAVAKGNVMGTQFHPEKSGTAGLRILKAFAQL